MNRCLQVQAYRCIHTCGEAPVSKYLHSLYTAVRTARPAERVFASQQQSC